MFVSADSIEAGAPEPLLDLLSVVVVAFRGRKDIEGVVQLHIEREMGIIGEGEFLRERCQSDFREEIAEEVNQMNDTAWDIAELKEEWFWKFLEYISKWFVEVDRSGVIATIVDPYEKLSIFFDDFEKFQKTLFWTRKMMEHSDRVRNIESIKEWHAINI